MAGKLSKAEWDARRKAALAVDLPPTGTITITIGDNVVTMPVVLRVFASGSRGYGLSERVNAAGGVFQAGLNLVQVGTGEYKA